MEVKLIGVDTSKAVFTLHGVDAAGCAVVRCDIRRAGLEAFFCSLPPTLVALATNGCGSCSWSGPRR